MSTAQAGDGVLLANVRVNGPGGWSFVTLSFHGDLTPVEAVAAFLRDLADVVASGSGVLLDVAGPARPNDGRCPVSDQELRAAVRALLVALDEEHERRPLQKQTTSLMSRARILSVDTKPARFHPQGTFIPDRSS